MLSGCSNPATVHCSDILEIIKRKEHNLRVDKIYTNGRSIFFEGAPLNKDSNFLDGFLHKDGSYAIEVKNRCSIGDTLYKERGSLSTIIKKKGINIELIYQCNDTSNSVKPILRIAAKPTKQPQRL
jgi:hypothetical protein